MVKEKVKAIHALKIKSNAPFSKKSIQKDNKNKFRKLGSFKSLVDFNVSNIKNYEKRQQILERKKTQINKLKRQDKNNRKNDVNREKLDPLTVDDKKQIDENFVFDQEENEELVNEELNDEFQAFYNMQIQPKIMLTTQQRPSKKSFDFLKDIKCIFGPDTQYWPRKQFSLEEIQQYAIGKGFTDILVFREHRKQVAQLILIHLPEGPTFYFKLTNFQPCVKIQNHGRFTDHNPELILNHFDTKVGRRVGRQLGALFPQNPDFKGRRVVTFHNQRDFIFFRHHRYMFQEEGNKVALQEIGPRFTLRLKKLEHGLFRNEENNIEFQAEDKMYVNRAASYL